MLENERECIESQCQSSFLLALLSYAYTLCTPLIKYNFLYKHFQFCLDCDFSIKIFDFANEKSIARRPSYTCPISRSMSSVCECVFVCLYIDTYLSATLAPRFVSH